MPILRAKNLSKCFQDSSHPVEALSKIDLAVEEGEIVCVVGPSGCGKTTLLRLLAGLESPTTGTVEYGTPGAAKYAFVFQKALLFPWRTVYENVLLPAELNGRTPTVEDQENAKKILAGVGLAGFENLRPAQLSGGMQQRGSLARALFTNAPLLFVDEPLSAVDELTRENLWVDFRTLWKNRRVSVVIVTHNIREASFFADRVLVMSNHPGRIVAEIPSLLPPARNLDTLYEDGFHASCRSIRNALDNRLTR